MRSSLGAIVTVPWLLLDPATKHAYKAIVVVERSSSEEVVVRWASHGGPRHSKASGREYVIARNVFEANAEPIKWGTQKANRLSSVRRRPIRRKAK